MAINGQKVREIREAKGWSQPDLARASGVSQQTIDLIERSKTKRTKFVIELADALECAPSELDPSYLSIESGARTSDELEAIPVRGAAAGSHEKGAFQFTGEDTDYIERPRALAGQRKVFAVYVVEDSMQPEHPHGALRIATPDRPAKPGDTVIIEAQDDPDAGEWAMIGHLVSRGDIIRIGKLNPERVIEVPSAFVKKIYKVLDLNELFGR